MVNETEVRSTICSTFEALVAGRCHGEELGAFCGPMPAASIAVLSASHWFAEHTSRMELFLRDSESCSGSDGQQTTKQWPWFVFLCL